MNRKYFILFVISGLLISNLMLVYYLVQKPNMNEENSPRNIIIDALQFDDDQSAKYDKLIITHKKEIREKNDQINVLKNTLYEMLPTDNISKTKVDSITKEIGNIQYAIENIHFNHFMDIKHLCTPSQLPAFMELSSELQKIFHAKRSHQNRSK